MNQKLRLFPTLLLFFGIIFIIGNCNNDDNQPLQSFKEEEYIIVIDGGSTGSRG